MALLRAAALWGLQDCIKDSTECIEIKMHGLSEFHPKRFRTSGQELLSLMLGLEVLFFCYYRYKRAMLQVPNFLNGKSGEIHGNYDFERSQLCLHEWQLESPSPSSQSQLEASKASQLASGSELCSACGIGIVKASLATCFFASLLHGVLRFFSKVMGRLSFTHEPWQWKISPDPADKGLTRSSQFLLLVLRCAPCTPCAFFLRRSKGQHCKHHQAHGPWLFVWSLMQHGHRSH